VAAIFVSSLKLAVSSVFAFSFGSAPKPARDPISAILNAPDSMVIVLQGLSLGCQGGVLFHALLRQLLLRG
jgi:hypothetical protein